jgi:hypothetical protein
MKPSHPQTPEAVGRTAVERKVGHFMTPLLIWLDPSLRASLPYRPRTLSAIASQVDIAPTILSLNGVMPRISPFLGRDLSCLLEADCAGDNVAYLSSVYDDLIGLAEGERILLYSRRNERLLDSGIDLQQPLSRRPEDPSVALRYRRLLALYADSNAVLKRNIVWSWRELGASL